MWGAPYFQQLDVFREGTDSVLNKHKVKQKNTRTNYQQWVNPETNIPYNSKCEEHDYTCNRPNGLLLSESGLVIRVKGAERQRQTLEIFQVNWKIQLAQ